MTDHNFIPWEISDVLAATGATLLAGDATHRFTGVGIDSRDIAETMLFVAIVGEVHDGHDFIPQVMARGVRGILVDKDRVDSAHVAACREKGVACIGVPDTTRALGDLSHYHRKRWGGVVVAITGTNGKTTTREMTAAVLRREYCTLSSLKNFNNEIGLPLSLLRLTSQHRQAVVELGMNHPGEIEMLGRICEPQIGMITNIGPGHLKGVGSIDGVMAAKAELLDTIINGGTAVLNADDPRGMILAGQTSHPVLLFGFSEQAHVRAAGLSEQGRRSRFTLRLPGETIDVRLPLPGRFMVSNALAAAAVGYRLGLGPEQIKEGLEGSRPSDGRSFIIDTANGIHLIDDTYNANPASVSAAISLLQSLGQGRSRLVIGDMRELGIHASALHREIGAMAARSDIGRLYIAGRYTAEVAQGALDGKMDPGHIFTGSRDEILEVLKKSVSAGDWILVKGSRAMGMEKIIEGLLDWAGGPVGQTP